MDELIVDVAGYMLITMMLCVVSLSVSATTYLVIRLARAARYPERD